MIGQHLRRIAGWLEGQAIENFHCTFFDLKREVITDEVMWTGDATSVPCYPNEVIRRAIVLRASYLYLMHNHPVGDIKPSRQDLVQTAAIRRAADAVHLVLWDHVIVGPKGERYSMRDAGHITSSLSVPTNAIEPQRFASVAISTLSARSTLYPQYAQVFQGHGWLIALAMFRSKEAVMAKELPLMTHVPYTSGLRYLAALQQVGLAKLARQGSKAITAQLTTTGRSVISDVILASC